MAEREIPKTVGVAPFDGELRDCDPVIHDLIELEEERQVRRLIMIPSESLCHPTVRRSMESVYGNLYAEGYPSSMATYLPEADLADLPAQLVHYRRYADRRFYKGTDYANQVEALCRRRAADLFANPNAASERIFANVQALSGAAANLAVFEAFLEPGDTIMGMDLMQGGHLSHGSEFHMSGKRYKVVPYGISPATGRLDYDRMEKLALENRPNLIIAGFTSYPWAPDWPRLRQIADACGALLMADIAHPAGMASAGAYPNPVGIADVTTFTTHKTLMGPRGAIILTTDEEKAQMIDLAVFPGEQGGPHVNTITALAVALKLAQSDEFKRLQHRIVANAQRLCAALQANGLSLAYGGTDTHLFLIDLKKLPRVTDEMLRGEMAVRLLELCGIVANKNTLPGDDLTAMATGVRMGTPWITQRGITDEQIDRLGELVARIIKGIHPFHFDGLLGTLPRGKVEFAAFEAAKRDVADLAGELAGEAPRSSGYPHYSLLKPLPPRCPTEQTAEQDTTAAMQNGAALFAVPGGVIRVTGARVEAHIQNLITGDASALAAGETLRTLMLDGQGDVLDDVLLARLPLHENPRHNGFLVIPHPERAHHVLAWMRGHADGYLLFEPDDLTAKVEGPVVVEDLAAADAPLGEGLHRFDLVGAQATAWAHECTGKDGIVLAAGGESLATLLVPAARAEAVQIALIKLGATLCALATRREAVIEAGLPQHPLTVASLIEAGDTAWFAMHKPYFVGQRLLREALPPAAALPEFVWTEPENPPLKRTSLYETHTAISKKMVPFAGWEMPVWYTSTLEEHKAVREACALFDISHMGCFEVSGPNATAFLDFASTNYARWIGDGQSYYSYLLDPDAQVLDDIMVYRLAAERYLLVVNASNEDKDWAWLNAVNTGDVLCDRDVPQRRIVRPTVLRNLKDPVNGEDCRVVLALQGPRSGDALRSLIAPEQLSAFMTLKRTDCGEFTLAGLPVVISRTGYTGERIGFELFVHPERAPELWATIVEAGRPFELVPAGLAARDSTRTEAGLPLYGHELEGPYGMTPGGAGFPSYVKFHKPFFIGKRALLAKEATRDKETVRFTITERGTKPIKPGDKVAGNRGDFIGHVTSAVVLPDGSQVGLAYVLSKAAKPGRIAVFPMVPENRRKGLVMPLDMGEKTRTPLPVQAEIVDRFPPKAEAKFALRDELAFAAKHKA